MSKRIVLFNGPPRCGKDTAVNYLWQRYNYGRLKMSQPLKDAAAAFFNLTSTEQNAVERLKDDAHPLLLGNIYRQVQISLSEDWAKQVFGPSIFGHLAVRRMWRLAAPVVCISDSGFAEEVKPLIGAVGVANILLVRIHREGCTFDGDSRSYIDLPSVATLEVQNHMTLAQFHSTIDTVVRGWLSQSAK